MRKLKTPFMHSPLLYRVHELRAAAYRLVLICGLARFASAAILSFIGLGLIDYLLRVHDPIARWLMSASLAMLLAISFWKLVVPALRLRPSLVATARRIERRFPELGERLSTAVAFLHEAADEPAAGSSELRRAVVAEAEASVANMNLSTALDGRASTRALTSGGIAFLIAVILAVIDPATMGLALSRMIAPWRNLPWPRKHELLFVNAPSRLAKGEDFQALIVDRGSVLPDDLEVQIRQRGAAGAAIESRHIQAIGRETVFRLNNVTSAMEYRARGGDDNTMPWQEIVLVEPPKISELQMIVHPPAYSGLAMRVEGPVVTALVGSELEIRGTVDQQIQRANLKSVSSSAWTLALDLTVDRQTFRSPATGSRWTAEESGAFDVELLDQHGMVFGRSARIELHAVKDRPPSIAWESPVEHVFMTARAALPIKATIEDDLAVHTIEFRLLHPRKSDEEEVIELYRAANESGPVQQLVAAPPLGAGEGAVHEIHSTCDLSRLANLEPGDSLTIRLTADDYSPQTTTTAARRITVITDEEFEKRIAAQQSAVLSQLGEALATARQCREQTRSLQEQIRERGPAAANLSGLEAARYSLRQIQRLVGGESDGAVRQIGGLLDELAANRMEQASISRRLRELLKRVESLHKQSLPALDQVLSDVLKRMREADAANDLNIDATDGSSPNQEAILEQLGNAGEQEAKIIQELEQMTGAIANWDNLARITREVNQLRADQGRLAEDTDDLKLRAISADAVDSDRLAAHQLSQRQLELARRVDKLQMRMEEQIARGNTGDSPASHSVAEGLAAARWLAIGARMREAAAQLGRFQLEPARQNEQQAFDALSALTQRLSSYQDGEPAGEPHERAEQTVVELVARQKKLIVDTNWLDKGRSGDGVAMRAQTAELKNLAAEQRRLAEDTTNVKATFAHAAAFPFAIEMAARNMQQAGEMLLRGQTTAVTQDVQRAALDRLEQILSALRSDEAGSSDQTRAQGQEAEQGNASRVSPEEIKLVRFLQQSINDRTGELESIRSGTGSLNAEQRRELDALTQEQGQLADMVQKWVKRTSHLPSGEEQ